MILCQNNYSYSDAFICLLIILFLIFFFCSSSLSWYKLANQSGCHRNVDSDRLGPIAAYGRFLVPTWKHLHGKKWQQMLLHAAGTGSKAFSMDDITLALSRSLIRSLADTHTHEVGEKTKAALYMLYIHLQTHTSAGYWTFFRKSKQQLVVTSKIRLQFTSSNSCQRNWFFSSHQYN